MPPKKAYGGNRFCMAMTKHGTKPRFTPRKSAKVQYDCDIKLRRQNHKIVNFFGLIR